MKPADKTEADVLTGLPAESLIREGLAERQAGRPGVASCLVAIASPRLRRLGLIGSDPPLATDDAEQRLYHLLLQEKGDAYSRYNALIRELISFEQALDRRLRLLATAKS